MGFTTRTGRTKSAYRQRELQQPPPCSPSLTYRTEPSGGPAPPFLQPAGRPTSPGVTREGDNGGNDAAGGRRGRKRSRAAWAEPPLPPPSALRSSLQPPAPHTLHTYIRTYRHPQRRARPSPPAAIHTGPARDRPRSRSHTAAQGGRRSAPCLPLSPQRRWDRSAGLGPARLPATHVRGWEGEGVVLRPLVVSETRQRPPFPAREGGVLWPRGCLKTGGERLRLRRTPWDRGGGKTCSEKSGEPGQNDLGRGLRVKK